MDSKEIQELLKLVNRLELAEFKYKQGDIEFSVRTKFYSKARNGYESGSQMASMHSSSHSQSQPQVQNISTPKPPLESEGSTPSTAPPASKDNLVEIRSPIVGTFYRSASPDKPMYVKPGDTIEVGTVVCIVEAMKLFNEIESEVAGKVVKILVEDASPVEYDQLLFLIDPNG